ncbi:hypothetical protein [Serratia quinivorans]|uniref:hypothetical protein n=1 Tax=Serratia quinivorans TaxID=137545 RepID=UPI0034C65976
MSQTRNQQAYQRGIRVARMWKRLKSTILRWDTFCVSKARKHKLPSWIGHVPIAVAFLGSVTAALLGGILIAGSLLFIWSIALIIQNIGQSSSSNLNYENNSLEDSKKSADYAYESAVMNNEYDGAPYKSPADN